MRRLQVLLGFACAFAGAPFGVCDSWMTPRQRESVSQNSNFVAVVQPGTKTNKAIATVYRVFAGTRSRLWNVELSNPVAPVSTFVSPSGKHLVTFDDWAGIGYGNNVVAIYNASGLLEKYSLEEFAPPPQWQTNGWLERLKERVQSLRAGGGATPRMNYFDVFSHSTSSRHWHADSIYFFFPPKEPTVFCVWLDWDKRWATWSLSDGDLINPTKAQIAAWNVEGRRQSLEKIAAGEAEAADYNFLGRTRAKEDRLLIEKWLTDSNFNTGHSQSTSGNNITRFALISSSSNRRKADEILSRWDGIIIPQMGSQKPYTFLGTVTGFVDLPSEPRKEDGFLRIWLDPQNGATKTKLANHSEHQLIANLEWHRPTDYSSGTITRMPLGTNIQFAIQGVTPGVYRVRALWDKLAPYCSETNRQCEASPGDIISTNGPIIEVRKGETSSPIRIECRTAVE